MDKQKQIQQSTEELIAQDILEKKKQKKQLTRKFPSKTAQNVPQMSDAFLKAESCHSKYSLCAVYYYLPFTVDFFFFFIIFEGVFALAFLNILHSIVYTVCLNQYDGLQ